MSIISLIMSLSHKSHFRSKQDWILTFAKMGSDDINLDVLADQTHARCLIAIHPTEPWTQVAIPQVGISRRPLLGGIDRTELLISRYVVIE